MFFKQHSSEGVLLPLWLNNGSGYGRYVTSTVPEFLPCRLAACLIRILFHKFCPFPVCFVLLISGAKLSSECAGTRHTGLFWAINNLHAMKSVFVYARKVAWLGIEAIWKNPLREIRPRDAWLVSPFFVSLNPSGALWTRNMPAKPD